MMLFWILTAWVGCLMFASALSSFALEDLVWNRLNNTSTREVVSVSDHPRYVVVPLFYFIVEIFLSLDFQYGIAFDIYVVFPNFSG